MTQTNTLSLKGSFSNQNLKKPNQHSSSLDLSRSTSEVSPNKITFQNLKTSLKPYNINTLPVHKKNENVVTNNSRYSNLISKSTTNDTEYVEERKNMSQSISVSPEKQHKSATITRSNIGKFDPLVISNSKFNKIRENGSSRLFRDKNEEESEERPSRFGSGVPVKIMPIAGQISQNNISRMKDKSDSRSNSRNISLNRAADNNTSNSSDIKLPFIEIKNKSQGYLLEKPTPNMMVSNSHSNLNLLNSDKSDHIIKKNALENQTKYIDLHVVKQSQNIKQQFSSKSAISRKSSKESLHENKRESNTEMTPIGKSLTGFNTDSRTRTASGKQMNSTKSENANAETYKSIFNFSFKSKPGSLPNKPIKTNQDAYIVYPNFASQRDKYIFAVCDGHGVNGHLVSNFVKQNLAKNIEMYYKSNNPLSVNEVSKSIRDGFDKTVLNIRESSIDLNFSGTTTVSCLIIGNQLWCANVGDSRAIIGKNRNREWIAQAVSRDHKPDDPLESQRIIESGGRIEPFKDNRGEDIGPHRVWLKHENIPGLAMARSIGDLVAASVGVIPIPEILYFDLKEEDKFLVIASDGVWEFLSNEQVVNMVAPYYAKNQLEAACEKLVKEATLKWKSEDEVVDDITCIIISLKIQSTNQSDF